MNLTLQRVQLIRKSFMLAAATIDQNELSAPGIGSPEWKDYPYLDTDVYVVYINGAFNIQMVDRSEGYKDSALSFMDRLALESRPVLTLYDPGYGNRLGLFDSRSEELPVESWEKVDSPADWWAALDRLKELSLALKQPVEEQEVSNAQLTVLRQSFHAAVEHVNMLEQVGMDADMTVAMIYDAYSDSYGIQYYRNSEEIRLDLPILFMFETEGGGSVSLMNCGYCDSPRQSWYQAWQKGDEAEWREALDMLRQVTIERIDNLEKCHCQDD